MAAVCMALICSSEHLRRVELLNSLSMSRASTMICSVRSPRTRASSATLRSSISIDSCQRIQLIRPNNNRAPAMAASGKPKKTFSVVFRILVCMTSILKQDVSQVAAHWLIETSPVLKFPVRRNYNHPIFVIAPIFTVYRCLEETLATGLSCNTGKFIETREQQRPSSRVGNLRDRSRLRPGCSDSVPTHHQISPI